MATISWAFAPGRRSLHLVERFVIVWRRGWKSMLISQAVESLLFLVAFGAGVGRLIGDTDGASYFSFVLPGLMAAGAMNTAVYDGTAGVFARIRFQHSYESMVVTPIEPEDIALGELLCAGLQALLHSVLFMGLLLLFGPAPSATSALALVAALLTGLTFAALTLFAVTFFRTWADFGLLQLVLMPSFLLSGAFYPVSAYPAPLAAVVALTPLYHGVALTRNAAFGRMSVADLGHAAYLTVLLLITYSLAQRRLRVALRD